MLEQASTSSEFQTLRWNPRLSKAFDVAQERFPAASAEEALVSKYLDVDIKHLERRKTQVMSVRMGAFLTALNDELRTGWMVDDIRNLDWQGKETTPLYETIELNSTRQADFLIDGMRFIRIEDTGSERRATIRLQPRWYGLDVTTYGLRSAGTAQTLLATIVARAREINFLKGEAFSLSGEFLPRTTETFDDLFLDPANAVSVQRVITLINTRGKALENRGVLLMGPPGTGKTLSARIVRNQAQATFIWVSARDFHYAGSFGGFTEAFDLARECAPSVVVFEDVDNWLYDTTVDLLKTEMDGVARSTGVVTMMTTNFPELLPAALIDRPGRFHDVLRFGLPNASARKQMLERWLPGLGAQDLTKAVDATAGYSGAHVRELARFALIIAEQDQLTLPKALASALSKLAEQRELITATQQSGSRYRMPSALISKCGVRLKRAGDFAEKGDSIAKMHRAFSDLQIKEISESGRRFTGMATTPRPDRVGDVIEPMGVEFSNPLSLLLFHNGTQPVGEVTFGRPTKEGIPFEAVIPEIAEPGIVKDLTDQAWHLVKYRLAKAVSVGFRFFVDHMERIADSGWRFLKTEVMELSIVSIPANPDALIHNVKSLKDASHLAASGTRVKHASSATSPGATGNSVVRLRPQRPDTSMTKTIAEQITALEATRAAKMARMEEVMQKSIDDGRSTDANEQEEFDELQASTEAIDKDLVRLKALERAKAGAAKPIGKIDKTEDGTRERSGIRFDPPKLLPGIAFARLARVKALAKLDGESPRTVAKELYGEDSPVFRLLSKAAVPAATTTDPTWAGALVGDETAVFADFVEFLRAQTILGRFGMNGVPSLRRVPFRVPLIGQTSGGSAYWTGEGKAKGLTKFDFERKTLEPLKVANIAVATMEVLRDSSPSAEMIVRDQLAAALRERLDLDFIDPAKPAVPGVSPASITNGIVAIPSSGTDAAAVREDIKALFGAFIAANNAPTDGVWIMPATIALALSLMQNPLGQSEFPGISMNGGTFFGLPAIVSQYVPAGFVVLANASDIYLADEGGIAVDMSTQASLQMDDAPTNDSDTPTPTSLVSLWQTNSVGFRAERTINWMRRRESSTAVLSGVDWGTAGSP